jgi:hypothetical protein
MQPSPVENLQHPHAVVLWPRYMMRYRGLLGQEQLMLACADSEGGWWAVILPGPALLRQRGDPVICAGFRALARFVREHFKLWGMEPGDWQPIDRYLAIVIREVRDVEDLEEGGSSGARGVAQAHPQDPGTESKGCGGRGAARTA